MVDACRRKLIDSVNAIISDIEFQHVYKYLSITETIWRNNQTKSEISMSFIQLYVEIIGPPVFIKPRRLSLQKETFAQEEFKIMME